jgi:hypothetical protein
MRDALHLGTFSLTIAIPVKMWHNWALKERAKIVEEVETKIRFAGIEDGDDVLVDKMKPGDVVLFDRRCERCAAGPWAALACYTSRKLLCNPVYEQTRALERGKFNHCGTLKMNCSLCNLNLRSLVHICALIFCKSSNVLTE